MSTTRKLRWLLLTVLLIPLGGCEFSCRSNADNDVEEAIEEVGDKIEDATD